MRLELGTPVQGADGELGMLADLVVNPRSRTVTHLVVEPVHHEALARLVPISLAARRDGAPELLTLRCGTRDFRGLPEVHELSYGRLYDFPVEDPDWEPGITDVLPAPTRGIPGLGPEPEAVRPPAVSYDVIPKGEVELRRRSPVITAEGSPVGTVAALVAADDARITHLVLRRHWPRRPRRLTLPADAIAQLATDVVTLRVTKRELCGRAT